MTADETRAAALALIERSRKAQGLPFHIEDGAILAKIAAILHGAKP